MTGARERLPNRRRSVTFNLECAALGYTATVSFYDDDRLGEIFLSNHRADSHADACARDAAILTSIALQFGAPLNVLRKALLRDQRGNASTPISVALNKLAEEVSGKRPNERRDSESGSNKVMINKIPARPKFQLTLEPLPNVENPIRSLRHALKRLLRSYGLRCTDLHEETSPPEGRTQ
jgi:ribonucleoside-diphosphate reductase alpha chain